MPSQTRTWQQKILANAKRDNYADLYWYAEGQLPLSERKTKDGHFPAAWPGAWVPVIPVAPCAETSGHLAALMLEAFRLGNQGKRIEWALAITTGAMLSQCKLQWYLWGDTPDEVKYDLICPSCGTVTQFDIAQPSLCDCWTWQMNRNVLRKMGLCEVLSAYVDGAIHRMVIA